MVPYKMKPFIDVCVILVEFNEKLLKKRTIGNHGSRTHSGRGPHPLSRDWFDIIENLINVLKTLQPLLLFTLMQYKELVELKLWTQEEQAKPTNLLVLCKLWNCNFHLDSWLCIIIEENVYDKYLWKAKLDI